MTDETPIFIYQRRDLDKAAAWLTEYGKDRKIWLLNGPMGAGKTTLAREICACLGIEGPVSSPTFSLVNEYVDKNGKPVYHFDFYRMNNPKEALDFGLDEYIDSGSFCLLEWSVKVETLLPPGCLKINIEVIDENTRKLRLAVSP